MFSRSAFNPQQPSSLCAKTLHKNYAFTMDTSSEKKQTQTDNTMPTKSHVNTLPPQNHQGSESSKRLLDPESLQEFLDGLKDRQKKLMALSHEERRQLLLKGGVDIGAFL
jgi:hypothetical protein